MSGVDDRLELIKLKKELSTKLLSCFIGNDLDSRPTGNALDVITDNTHRGFWMVAGNRAGKTSTGAREVAWWFQNAHPFKTRPVEWGSDRTPLLIIVAGRTSTILSEEIWGNKLKPLLPPGSYKQPKYEGAAIKSVEHVSNGNRILFMSHHDAKNAREKAQGFTAHIVWLDEMPDDASFVTELLLRVSATGKVEPGMSLSGYFYATFTPLVENEDIKQIVDAATYPFRKVVLQLEDNPIYAGWSSEQLDDLIKSKCADPVEFRARRHGEWYYSGDRVFRGYDPTRNRKPLPFEYSRELQHALSVDPAASGKVGVSLWVLNPIDRKTWWMIVGKKLEGDAASLLIPLIERDVVAGRYLAKNSRICDCSPSGFYKEARVQKIEYLPYRDKNDKKRETIEEVNVAFFNSLLMVAACDDTEEAHKEFLSAKWKPQENEIQNSHKYHVADTARYFWMKRPPPDEIPRKFLNHYHEAKQSQLAEEEKLRQAAARAKAKLEKQRRMSEKISRHWGRRRVL